MSYLLDTNVISELVRPKPAKAVLAWFENIPSEALHISVLTLGEIRKGIEQMPDGARRENSGCGSNTNCLIGSAPESCP